MALIFLTFNYLFLVLERISKLLKIRMFTNLTHLTFGEMPCVNMLCKGGDKTSINLPLHCPERKSPPLVDKEAGPATGFMIILCVLILVNSQGGDKMEQSMKSSS